MMKTRVLYLFLALLATAQFAEAKTLAQIAVKAPDDSVSLSCVMPDESFRPVFIVTTTGGDKRTYKPSIQSIGWPKVITKNRAIWIDVDGKLLVRDLHFPDPEHFGGTIGGSELYHFEKMFPEIVKKSFTMDFRYNPRLGITEAMLGAQYVGKVGNGKVKSVDVLDPNDWRPKGDVEVGIDVLSLDGDVPDKLATVKPYRADDNGKYRPLAPRGMEHASDRLKKGNAKLSINPGFQKIDGVPMQVFSINESLDAGRHNKVGGGRSLFVDPYFNRSAFCHTPMFMQWCVPADFYGYAWILCANIGKANEASLGVQISRLSNLGQTGFALSVTDISHQDDCIRKVGTLTWTEEGQQKTTDLLLVRHYLNIGMIIDLINDKAIYGNPKDSEGPLVRRLRDFPQIGSYLDFEIAGGGAYQGMGGYPRSAVQVFGITLESSPYGVEMVQYEHGNIFAGDDKPETGVELTASEDGAKGELRYTVADINGKTVKDETVPFELGKIGEKKVLKLDLPQAKNGWYSLLYEFRDANGKPLFGHPAAFALLGPDTREAGFESPYAGWAHVYESGRHWNNPNRREVAEMMWKEGIRTSWEPPNKTEDEFPEYPITMSQYQGAKNPLLDKKTKEPVLTDDAKMSAYFDEKIAEYAKYKKAYPHLNTWLVLHEWGGRDLAEEMLYLKPIKDAYKNHNLVAQYNVKYCNEMMRRAKEAFPGIKMQLGNSSSSGQQVAWMIRDGIDMSLVDKLGIESKGFSTLPEFCANREAPGMLWALHETGKRYGYDLPVSACNEYVFRPDRGNSHWTAVLSVRDYLISLGWGCDCISTGHLEDSRSNYYNSNWGCGGHCKVYPYSYPKPLYVALATFTKVFDCCGRPRRIPTNGNTTYALEFPRNRKVKDFATAFWTIQWRRTAKVSFPKGTKVVEVDMYGVEKPRELADDGHVEISFSETPTYLVASAKIDRIEASDPLQEPIDPEKTKTLAVLTPDDLEFDPTNAALGDQRKCPEAGPSGGFGQQPVPGEFKLSIGSRVGPQAARGGPSLASSPEVPPYQSWGAQMLEATLLNNGEYVPEVCWQYGYFKFKKPVKLTKGSRLGVWVDGNGSFGMLAFNVRDNSTKKTFSVFPGQILFDGLAFIQAPNVFGDNCELIGIWIPGARVSLDPLEMVPITKPIRIGPLVEVFDKIVEQPVAKDPTAAMFKDSMDAVDDKDL